MNRFLVSSRQKLPLSSLAAVARKFSTNDVKLLQTVYHDMHLELGGKMVDFAGYSLPVQYEGLGVLKEHTHTRTKGCASLFDVSHMGQIKWFGRDAAKFLELVVCGDISSLKVGDAKLTLIMNEQGGIVDDSVVANCGEYLYMVVNGGCKAKDMIHFSNCMSTIGKGLDVRMAYQADAALVALQGDGAKTALGRLAPDLNLAAMGFMTTCVTTVAGIPDVRVTRCGYTGEDGFEISVPDIDAVELAKALLGQPEVKPAGLGARDSLRLEAGLCLYGHDIDESISPVEAGLQWTIGGPKARRRLEQGFLGASHFLQADGKLKKVEKKRVGITGMKAPAREGTQIFSSTDSTTPIGEVTSGGFGPSFKGPVAMGYIATEHAKEGTEIQVSIRNKLFPAQITKMPFVPANYFKPE